MKTLTSNEVIRAAIDSEREYQIRKWGHGQKLKGLLMQPQRTVGEYILYQLEYIDAMIIAARGENQRPALDALRKIVALGVANLELNHYYGDRANVYANLFLPSNGGTPVYTILSAALKLKHSLEKCRSAATRNEGDGLAIAAQIDATLLGVKMMQEFGAPPRDLELPVEQEI